MVVQDLFDHDWPGQSAYTVYGHTKLDGFMRLWHVRFGEV